MADPGMLTVRQMESRMPVLSRWETGPLEEPGSQAGRCHFPHRPILFVQS